MYDSLCKKNGLIGITVYLSPDDLSDLIDLADSQGLPLSVFVRLILKDFLLDDDF